VLIYGKEVRAALLAAIRADARAAGMTLAVIQIGAEAASAAYVNSIEKFAGEAGVGFQRLELAETISQAEVLAVLDRLNQDGGVTGVMLQTPLPAHLNQAELVQRLAPGKDVEGITAYRQGLLLSDPSGVAPCTAKAVMRLLKAQGVSLRGKRVTVVGQSVIVGKPLALMLMAERATVTVCNSGTLDLKRETAAADIVVAAVGSRGIIGPDMVRPGALIIDVGTNFAADGKMYGDVAPEVADIATLSAVPGGVGTITVAELFDNLLKL
jgi:methylenetetrahydrofolate dehydrogenase (NADP+)/methenyltetrahydrofolate cyclohydrolase